MTPTELRAARLSLGLGTPRMGRALGIDPRHLRRLEAGQHPISRTIELAVQAVLAAARVGKEAPAPS